MNDEIKPRVVPVQEARDELEREYNVRTRCFPKWIAEGRLSRTDAQDRLNRLFTAVGLLAAAGEQAEKQRMLRESLEEAPIVPRPVTSSGDLQLQG